MNTNISPAERTTSRDIAISLMSMITLLSASLITRTARGQQIETIDIGSNRQLFVDRLLIDKLDGASLRLHHPVRREVVIRNDNPWEQYGVSYMVTFRDGGLFRAWYRCDAADFDTGKRSSMTAYAESSDGIRWTKPNLGVIAFQGSKENNLVWNGPGVNMAVFKDGNPAAPPDERYKAIVRNGDIYGLVSADGLHWKLIDEKPFLTDRPFDSHNTAFWDAGKQEYVIYARGIQTAGVEGLGMSKNFKSGVRSIRRSTSKDFRNWSALELIDLGDRPAEHLYTNAAVTYDRAPGLYLMFPSRFVNTRRPTPNWKHAGVNDVVLMSSRDGLHFERTFMEAFVRPGLDKNNWHDRALYMERGILQTSPTELSMYAMQNWRLDSVHIQRLTLRPDGFVSVHAPYDGGELLTKPMRFSEDRLQLNLSTSAVGSVLVELQRADGTPLPGKTLDDCVELYGDALDRPVQWKAGSSLSEFAGEPIRLRLMLRDADVYAFRFAE